MIDKNDPRLTSFVLGELDRKNAAEVSAAIEASPELQCAVKEIEKATTLLGEVFQNEPSLSLHEDQREMLRQSASASSSTASTEAPNGSVSLRSIGAQGWLAEYRSTLLAAAAALMLLVAGTLYYEPIGTATRSEVALADKKTDATKEPIEEEMSDVDSATRGDELDELTKVDSVKTKSMVDKALPVGKPASKSLLVMSPADSPDRLLESSSGGGFGGGGGFESRKMSPIQKSNAENSFPGAPSETGVNSVTAMADSKTPKVAAPATPNAGTAFDVSADDGQSKGQIEPVVMPPQVSPRELLVRNKEFGLPDAEASPQTVELAARNSLMNNVQEVLGKSTLNSLDFQVETKVKTFVIEMPMFETQLEQSEGLKVTDAGGGKPVTENYRQSRPITAMVTRPTTVRFVQPIVKLDPQAAEALVDQLASNVDPEEKMTLSLEDLIGIQGEVLVASDQQNPPLNDPGAVDVSRDSPKDSLLGRGRFSKKESGVNSMEGRASQAMVGYLRKQIKRQTVAEKKLEEKNDRRSSPMRKKLSSQAESPETQDKSMTGNSSRAPAPESVLANGPEAASESESPRKAETKAKTKAVVDQPSAVTIHWKEVKSVEELDCSELVKQLKSVLEKRNQRVRQQQR